MRIRILLFVLCMIMLLTEFTPLAFGRGRMARCHPQPVHSCCPCLQPVYWYYLPSQPIYSYPGSPPGSSPESSLLGSPPESERYRIFRMEGPYNTEDQARSGQNRWAPPTYGTGSITYYLPGNRFPTGALCTAPGYYFAVYRR